MVIYRTVMTTIERAVTIQGWQKDIAEGQSGYGTERRKAEYLRE